MSEEAFNELVKGLEWHAEDPERQAAAKLLRLYREALQWGGAHDRVSVAAARRAQRVAAGACYEGKRPHEVLGEPDPRERQ